MDAYEIYNIIPRNGMIQSVHGVILGRRCWIADVRVGKRGLLMVDVGDSKIGPHRIRLSVILRVMGMPGDPQVQIETENTKYMKSISNALKAYMQTHPFDSGDPDCKTVLDQLYQAYAESHESDPAEIGDGFKELEEFLCSLPLEDNNAVFNLCCRLCSAYERKSFLDGLQYGAELMLELGKEVPQ